MSEELKEGQFCPVHHSTDCCGRRFIQKSPCVASSREGKEELRPCLYCGNTTCDSDCLCTSCGWDMFDTDCWGWKEIDRLKDALYKAEKAIAGLMSGQSLPLYHSRMEEFFKENNQLRSQNEKLKAENDDLKHAWFDEREELKKENKILSEGLGDHVLNVIKESFDRSKEIKELKSQNEKMREALRKIREYRYVDVYCGRIAEQALKGE